jgi:hypothetical protein
VPTETISPILLQNTCNKAQEDVKTEDSSDLNKFKLKCVAKLITKDRSIILPYNWCSSLPVGSFDSQNF